MYEEINDYQPFSLEAEQSVLGGILLDPNKFTDISEMLSDDQFFMVSHQIIYRAMCCHCDQHSEASLDPVTVIAQLENVNLLEEAGGLTYLAELAQQTPSSSNIKAYARRVIEKAQERDVLNLSKDMAEAIKSPDGSSSERVNDALGLAGSFDFKEDRERDKNDILKEVIRQIENRANSKEPINGLRTGFTKIDERTNGFQNTDLIILAARPAMGKTTFALNIVEASLNNGKPGASLVFSMEMSAEQIMGKLICSNGKINLKRFRDGGLQDHEWVSLQASIGKLKESNIVIDDRPALTLQQVRAKAIREKRKHGVLKVVVIDYLQLMVGKAESRVMEITKISQGLKALAKELDCPVVALSQLNRSLEQRSDKRPKMSDLRDSGAIEQDADQIFFLYRDEVYNENSDRAGICEVLCEKFRNGETGTDFLATKLHQSRFLDLPHDYSPPEEGTGGYNYN